MLDQHIFLNSMCKCIVTVVICFSDSNAYSASGVLGVRCARFVVNCYPVAIITATGSATLGGVAVALATERGHVHAAKKVSFCNCAVHTCTTSVVCSFRV